MSVLVYKLISSYGTWTLPQG